MFPYRKLLRLMATYLLLLLVVVGVLGVWEFGDDALGRREAEHVADRLLYGTV